MSALADRLGIDASYVTTIADQLEERGLIERQPHPTDRRIKSLAPTPEGRRLREKLADELWVEVPVLDALIGRRSTRARGGSSHGPSRRQHRETECAPDRQHLEDDLEDRQREVAQRESDKRYRATPPKQGYETGSGQFGN